ncbi:hypothetical protein HDU76_002733 [Blyttiomyces sp. JEL0837]|nr:hypothetical protein HDU76_002733 [Blyttiomyces sp. JEL0837]
MAAFDIAILPPPSTSTSTSSAAPTTTQSTSPASASPPTSASTSNASNDGTALLSQASVSASSRPLTPSSSSRPRSASFSGNVNGSSGNGDGLIGGGSTGAGASADVSGDQHHQSFVEGLEEVRFRGIVRIRCKSTKPITSIQVQLRGQTVESIKTNKGQVELVLDKRRRTNHMDVTMNLPIPPSTSITAGAVLDIPFTFVIPEETLKSSIPGTKRIQAFAVNAATVNPPKSDSSRASSSSSSPGLMPDRDMEKATISQVRFSSQTGLQAVVETWYTLDARVKYSVPILGQMDAVANTVTIRSGLEHLEPVAAQAFLRQATDGNVKITGSKNVAEIGGVGFAGFGGGQPGHSFFSSSSQSAESDKLQFSLQCPRVINPGSPFHVVFSIKPVIHATAAGNDGMVESPTRVTSGAGSSSSGGPSHGLGVHFSSSTSSTDSNLSVPASHSSPPLSPTSATSPSRGRASSFSNAFKSSPKAASSSSVAANLMKLVVGVRFEVIQTTCFALQEMLGVYEERVFDYQVPQYLLPNLEVPHKFLIHLTHSLIAPTSITTTPHCKTFYSLRAVTSVSTTSSAGIAFRRAISGPLLPGIAEPEKFILATPIHVSRHNPEIVAAVVAKYPWLLLPVAPRVSKGSERREMVRRRARSFSTFQLPPAVVGESQSQSQSQSQSLSSGALDGGEQRGSLTVNLSNPNANQSAFRVGNANSSSPTLLVSGGSPKISKRPSLSPVVGPLQPPSPLMGYSQQQQHQQHQQQPSPTLSPSAYSSSTSSSYVRSRCARPDCLSWDNWTRIPDAVEGRDWRPFRDGSGGTNGMGSSSSSNSVGGLDGGVNMRTNVNVEEGGGDGFGDQQQHLLPRQGSATVFAIGEWSWEGWGQVVVGGDDQDTVDGGGGVDGPSLDDWDWDKIKLGRAVPLPIGAWNIRGNVAGDLPRYEDVFGRADGRGSLGYAAPAVERG